MTNGVKMLVGGSLISLIFGGFFYSVVDEGVGAFQYYHTLGELNAALQDGKADVETGLRLNGSVVKGSIQRDLQNGRIAFMMTDGTSQLPVVLNRLDVSDLFKDDAIVVVEGRLTQAGTFEAQQLFAKCPTKYEAAEEKAQGTTAGAAEVKKST